MHGADSSFSEPQNTDLGREGDRPSASGVGVHIKNSALFGESALQTNGLLNYTNYMIVSQ
jgi:hypothetical protein